MFESVVPAILGSPDLSCQRCSLEILCSCRPQRQVATADSSLTPSRPLVTYRMSRSGLSQSSLSLFQVTKRNTS